MAAPSRLRAKTEAGPALVEPVAPMTAPLEVSGSASEAQPEAVLSGAPGGIQGRSLSQIAWMRLKRDRFAIVGFILICLLILVAICARWIVKAFGHPPNEFHQDLIDPSIGTPPAARGGMNHN